MTRSILINATPCVIGGGVQVATGLIRHAARDAQRRGWKLLVLASEPVARQCAQEAARYGVEVRAFAAGPAAPCRGRHTRRALREAVEEIEADLVFTVFGPSYVEFEVPELMGFADGFTICPFPGCYANHPWHVALDSKLRKFLKTRKLRHATEYWVETETARRGLAKVARVSPERVHVVPNGVNELILAHATGREPAAPGDILMLGAPYWHKNHRLIIPVAQRLQHLLPDRPWRFLVTLPESSPHWLNLKSEAEAAGVGNRLKNLGVIPISECTAAYESATLVFHPSLLETFSATYVEAMALDRPLAVSDRPFAREICADAAAYFDPLDPDSAAGAVARLLTDDAERARLVALGREQLKKFPDAAAKNGRLCDLIDEFAQRHQKPGK